MLSIKYLWLIKITYSLSLTFTLKIDFEIGTNFNKQLWVSVHAAGPWLLWAAPAWELGKPGTQQIIDSLLVSSTCQQIKLIALIRHACM
jgi:hypothetical protein